MRLINREHHHVKLLRPILLTTQQSLPAPASTVYAKQFSSFWAATHHPVGSLQIRHTFDSGR